MMEMPIRTGRTLRGAASRVRRGIDRSFNDRQQVNSMHRPRMSCADSMRTFTNTQDWTNSLGMSPSGRFRVVEEAKPKQKFFSREGIRWDAAWIALAAVAILCAAILLADVAGMGLGTRSIGRLGNKIEDQTRVNEQMKQELALNAGEVSVCTEAVKLNLISGSAAQTIHLTAPQGSGAVTAELQSASSGWMTNGGGN